jgi:hypothetical protein
MSPLSRELNERIDVLSGTPARIQALLSGLRDDELRSKPGPEAFSMVENVLHLRDIEVEGYAPRLERIFREDRPRFADIDGARLARERNYNAQPLAPALEAFLSCRGENLLRLRAGLPVDFDRKAEMEGLGQVTLGDLLRMWCEHDLEHLRDMEALALRLRKP